MRHWQRGLVVLIFVVALGPGASEEAASQPRPDLDFRVSLDELGFVEAASKPTLAAIAAAVPNATDVFVFSHGWNNDRASAEKAYRDFTQGMVAMRPAGRLPATFKPFSIGLYWPSALFPLSCTEAASGKSAVDGWARAAFPSAVTRPGFNQEVDRIHKAVDDELKSGPIARATVEELAGLVSEWSVREGSGRDAEMDGEATILGQSADATLRFYEDALARNRDVASAGNLKVDSLCGVLNVTTFWTMKRRAGVVGARGGYEILTTIRKAGGAAVKIHLIGHSFGTKVLSAALLGVAGQAAQRVSSLTLLQGAFSHFGFTEVAALRSFGINATSGGLYAAVVNARLVDGYVAVTYSPLDRPNAIFYPLGAAVAQDYLAFRMDPNKGPALVTVFAARPRDEAIAAPPLPRSGGVAPVPKYGALGANGSLGTSGKYFKLTTGYQGNGLPRDRGVLNVDASDVITGHSDYFKDEVYRLLWDVVLLSR